MDELQRSRLIVAAHCGHPAAREQLGEAAPPVAPDLDVWLKEWESFAVGLVGSSSLDPSGRIWFPGNSWPLGHALEKLSIEPRLTEDKLEVGVSLGSADYDADPSVADPEDGANWQYPGSWINYGRCGFNGRFDRSPDDELLDFAGEVVLTADAQIGSRLELEWDELSFESYVLGWDALSDHRLHLSTNADGTRSVAWAGRVANTYAGNDDLDHVFWVEHAALDPLAIHVNGEVGEQQAREWLTKFVANPETYRWDDGKFSLA